MNYSQPSNEFKPPVKKQKFEDCSSIEPEGPKDKEEIALLGKQLADAEKKNDNLRKRMEALEVRVLNETTENDFLPTVQSSLYLFTPNASCELGKLQSGDFYTANYARPHTSNSA